MLIRQIKRTLHMVLDVMACW